jgi:hypothetical protein
MCNCILYLHSYLHGIRRIRLIFNNLKQLVDFESNVVDLIREQMGDDDWDAQEVDTYFTMDSIPFPAHVIFNFKVEWPKITVTHEYKKVWVHGEEES